MNEVKQNILLDTQKLFMQYGIKSVTMSDIARSLGISKKTLYTFYDKKEDLIAAGMLIHISEEKEKISEISENAKNAIDEILNIYRFIYTHINDLNPSLIYDLKKYYNKIWQQFEKYKNDFIYNLIYINLKRGIEEKLYRENFDAKIIAKLYIAKMDVIAEQDLFPKREFTMSEVYKEFAMYHLNAVLSDKGRTYLKKKRKNEV